MTGLASITANAPQFLKDEIDRRNREFAASKGLDHVPLTWNADSRDGKVKGEESNCVLIALSDSGALGTEVWLNAMPDAPGMTLQEFAEAHPTGNFLVCYIQPAKGAEWYPQHPEISHYSAMVDGVLYNAANSAPTYKISYVFEVLHKEDLEARGWTVEAFNEASQRFVSSLSDGAVI